MEGAKTPIETHTPLIRYFINDIDPLRTSLKSATLLEWRARRARRLQPAKQSLGGSHA
jgi:hypothetical protein